MNEEMINAIKEAKSVEELIAAAKESDIELTEEQAKEYFDRFHTSGELSDEELTSVAGGCRAYGHLTVTPYYICGNWSKGDNCKNGKGCINCSHKFINHGLMQCEIQ